MGVIVDAPVHLPDHPVKAGEQWTTDWKGVRVDIETHGVFQYREIAKLEEVEKTGPPRARISFTTTGQLEIPQDRNAQRGESTNIVARGTVAFDLQTGSVVSWESSGTITSEFKVGFKVVREIQAKYEEH